MKCAFIATVNRWALCTVVLLLLGLIAAFVTCQLARRLRLTGRDQIEGNVVNPVTCVHNYALEKNNDWLVETWTDGMFAQPFGRLSFVLRVTAISSKQQIPPAM